MVQAELTVAAVVCRERRFLMVAEHIGGERVFNQPAGHVEPSEKPTEAIVREVREETGLDFTPTGIVGFYHWPREAAQAIVRVAFCGRVAGPGVPRALDPDIEATQWLGADAISAEAPLRSPLVRAAIRDFERCEPLALDRLVELDASW